jgi:predicted RNA-binding protein YlxR (DUF448 family)
VACRQTSDKRTLVRVVRSTEGVVSVDPTGKANGRGAYVCLDADCIALAKKKGALGRSLKAAVVGQEVWAGLTSLLPTSIQPVMVVAATP